MALVTIKTYPDSSSCHVDKGFLEDHGIFASVSDENVIGSDGILLGAVGYVKLQVKESDVSLAKEKLNELYSGDTSNENEANENDDEEDVRYCCPQCGSYNITEYAPYIWTIMVPVLFPLFFIKRKYCVACRHKFSKFT